MTARERETAREPRRWHVQWMRATNQAIAMSLAGNPGSNPILGWSSASRRRGRSRSFRPARTGRPRTEHSEGSYRCSEHQAWWIVLLRLAVGCLTQPYAATPPTIGDDRATAIHQPAPDQQQPSAAGDLLGRLFISVFLTVVPNEQHFGQAQSDVGRNCLHVLYA